MWDRLLSHPRGRISLRNLALLATGVLAAVFVGTITGEKAFAEDAYRTTSGFTYQGKSFTPKTLTAPDPRGLANTQDIYAYEHLDSTTNIAEYIYFTDSNSAATAATASYAAYNFTPPGTYTYIPGTTSLTISNNPPPGQAPPASAPAVTPTPSPQNAAKNTCNVPAIGWFICPVTSELATMIDGIYGVLMDFLDVKPLLLGGPIFDVWTAVKNIANICFVLVFLVIIFSQVTSLGISNYGIKKLIPRLIIGAILVNVSYWICALGVDISNFLGHGVYAFLMDFAKSFNAFKVDITWNGLADAILSGTAVTGAVAGLGLLAVTTAGSLAAALFTLLGMLISVALAAVTALFILLARQALLIVFTIVSPLAFVALVLPKTEKWFERWKDTFVAMLIMFPLFSLVFGGAVLAGAAIIVSANGNIFLILLGKGTQLLPLAITPLIIKFSSGVLGTIAQFTNNKNKGLVDRAKNWSNDQAEYRRKKSLANNSTFGRFNLGRGFAKMVNNQSIRQKREMEGFDAETEARALSTERFRRANLRAYRSEQNRSHIKSINDADLAEADAGYVSSNYGNRARSQRTVDSIHQTHEQIALNATRKAMAERKVADQQATMLSANDTFGERARKQAAGIMGEVGERSVKATAKTNASRYLIDDIKNIESTLEYDVSSNVNKLYTKFQDAKTDAERVAYTSIMAKRGAPGAIKLKNMMNDMDERYMSGTITQNDLNDYKELVLAQNSNITSIGKDVEFYFTNAAYGEDYGDPTLAGKVKTFAEITNETTTWNNLSADAFSRMNIINQMQGLKVMAHKDPAKFQSFVTEVLSSQSARANLKTSVRENMERHQDPNDVYWYNDPDHYNVPNATELTEFETHVLKEPARQAGDFSVRDNYEDKDAAYWKNKYDQERNRTASIVAEAERRANTHGTSFR